MNNYVQHKSEESTEDYLETILILSNRMQDVRSIDIVNEINYSKPSVSVALKNLKAKEYVTVSGEGFITLTPAGKEIADRIYERHTLLTKWLISLGVNSKTAQEDACKMEHDISPESFEAIKKSLAPGLK